MRIVIRQTDDAQGAIGLALSGGTLKAGAHIGVLRALEELGVKLSHIAGTSAGALVAALYAHGYSVGDMEGLVHSFPGPRLLDAGRPGAALLFSWLARRLTNRARIAQPAMPLGVIAGRRLLAYFEALLADRQAMRTFSAVATDLYSGRAIVYSNDPAVAHLPDVLPIHDIARTVLGSCALPGILSPVPCGPHLLVDGALRSYAPINILRQAGCTKIIVVHLNKLLSEWRPRSPFHVADRALDILLEETVENELPGDDVMILAPELDDVTWLSFDRLSACVEEGYACARANSDAIRRFLRTPRKAPGTARQRKS